MTKRKLIQLPGGQWVDPDRVVSVVVVTNPHVYVYVTTRDRTGIATEKMGTVEQAAKLRDDIARLVNLNRD